MEFNTRSLGQASEVDGRDALLRFGSQSILSFLTEDWHANRCGREVVQHGNHGRKYFFRGFMSFIFCCGEGAAARPEGRRYVRPKAVFRDALALYRAVPRRPRRGGLRRAAST